MGKAMPASTVSVAMSAGDNPPTGEGVHVGKAAARVGAGVGVGAPSRISPSEQPRLVASKISIRAAIRQRLVLREATRVIRIVVPVGPALRESQEDTFKTLAVRGWFRGANQLGSIA